MPLISIWSVPCRCRSAPARRASRRGGRAAPRCVRSAVRAARPTSSGRVFRLSSSSTTVSGITTSTSPNEARSAGRRSARTCRGRAGSAASCGTRRRRYSASSASEPVGSLCDRAVGSPVDGRDRSRSLLGRIWIAVVGSERSDTQRASCTRTPGPNDGGWCAAMVIACVVDRTCSDGAWRPTLSSFCAIVAGRASPSRSCARRRRRGVPRPVAAVPRAHVGRARQHVVTLADLAADRGRSVLRRRVQHVSRQHAGRARRRRHVRRQQQRRQPERGPPPRARRAADDGATGCAASSGRDDVRRRARRRRSRRVASRFRGVHRLVSAMPARRQRA